MQTDGRTYQVVASATEQLEIYLGNIRLLAGIMLSEGAALDYDRRHDYLRTIERSSRDLLEVAASLGDFAQLGLRQPLLEHSEFRLSELLEHAIDALAPLAAEKRCRLLLTVGAGEASISGDAGKLLQGLSGLLRHAVQIAAPASQIQIHLRASATGRRLEIQAPLMPSGCGHSSADGKVAHITRSTQSDLAAALASQMVELHGGTLLAVREADCQRFIAELS